LNSKLRDHTRNGSRFHIRFATLVDSSIHAAPPASFHGHQLRGGKVYHDWAMSTFPNGFHTGDSLGTKILTPTTSNMLQFMNAHGITSSFYYLEL
jgi:hypothetical protein